MKINATFWLKEEDDDEFSIPMNLYDLMAPPFKQGDQILIDIDDLKPADTKQFKIEVVKKFKEDNEELRKKLHFKTLKIIRVINYARFNNLNDGSLTYEYFCKIISEKDEKKTTKSTI